MIKITMFNLYLCLVPGAGLGVPLELFALGVPVDVRGPVELILRLGRVGGGGQGCPPVLAAPPILLGVPTVAD